MAKWALNTGWRPITGCTKYSSKKSISSPYQIRSLTSNIETFITGVLTVVTSCVTLFETVWTSDWHRSQNYSTSREVIYGTLKTDRFAAQYRFHCFASPLRPQILTDGGDVKRTNQNTIHYSQIVTSLVGEILSCLSENCRHAVIFFCHCCSRRFSFISKCSRSEGKTKTMFKFIA